MPRRCRIRNLRIVPREKEKIARRRKVRRFFGGLFRVISASIILVLLAVAGWRVKSYLQGSAHFKIDNVEVSGNQYLTEEEVLRLAGIEGQNIFGVRLSEVSRRIESHPRVLRATIWRQPPEQLLIKVLERSPVALLSLSNGLQEVDGFGVILPMNPRMVDFDLPVITGLSALTGQAQSSAPWGETSPKGGEALARAIAIIEHLRGPRFHCEISEINIGNPDNFILYLVGGCQVRMGNFDKRLSYLQKVLDDLRRRSLTPEYIDLRFEGKVVVKPK